MLSTFFARLSMRGHDHHQALEVAFVKLHDILSNMPDTEIGESVVPKQIEYVESAQVELVSLLECYMSRFDAFWAEQGSFGRLPFPPLLSTYMLTANSGNHQCA